MNRKCNLGAFLKKVVILFMLLINIFPAQGIECIQRNSIYRLKAVVKQETFWPNGEILNIYFASGSDVQKNFVIKQASMWTKYANLTFSFHTNEKPQPDADVIISFEESGNFSNIGIESLSIAHALKTTMNLEVMRSLETEHDRDIAARTVQHEFGHVLGFLHEHQSPYRSIKINQNMARNLCNSVGWTPEECDQNIIHQYSPDEIMATAFDFKSVMLYPMTRGTYNGWIINDNWQLSLTDKIMATLIYPGKQEVTKSKIILNIDKIIELHRPLGHIFKSKDVKKISLGFVPPESITSVKLKIILAKRKKNKEASIDVSSNGDLITTLIIPKDYPENKAIEFNIKEFGLKNLYTDNDNLLSLSSNSGNSGFIFLSAELEIELLNLVNENL